MRKRLAVACVAAALTVMGPAATATAEPYWQCVTFARLFSGIQLFGDAWTWWSKATGLYPKGSTPEAGAVLVFRPSGRMKLGHVAVVSQVLSDRIIQITHANWGGSRGKIEENVTLVDVSAPGDWSQVKVWYGPTNDLGGSVYPTYGFIYQTAQNAVSPVIRAATGSEGGSASGVRD